MTLRELVDQASDCRIIDAQTDTVFNLQNILIKEIIQTSNKQKLVFLYLNNSFVSLQTLLSFYLTSHILVLLSDSMPLPLKVELEDIYKPQFYYDEIRGGIIELNQDVNNFHPEIRLLLSTSGTTGSPKFVKLSDKNLISNAEAIIKYLPIQKDDITPLNLALYYSYGLSILHSNLLKNSTLVIGLPDFFSKDFWSCFEKYGFSSLAGVPYNYEMLNRIGFTQKEFPMLRYMTQAGGKLSVHLAEKFGNYAQSKKIPFYIMYGQTEATARMSYLPPEKMLERPDSIGIPIPNGRFEIDKNSNELLYFGPNVFGGYADCLKDLETYDQPEYLATGDLAEERDSFYYIIGRNKRMIKLFGQRVNLDETENMLGKAFESSIFACTCIDDKKMFVFYNNQRIDSERIVKVLKETLVLHHSAFKVKLISKFPLTANGKINYQKLLDIYGIE